jgi:hypothetical protein
MVQAVNKLYVWHGVLEDYTSGNICALATDEQGAWEALFKADKSAYFHVLGLDTHTRFHHTDTRKPPFTAAELRRLAPKRARPVKYTKPFAVATWGGG